MSATSGEREGRHAAAEVAGVIGPDAIDDPVALAAADLRDGEIIILSLRPHPLFVLLASAGSLIALVIGLVALHLIASRGWLPIDAGMVTTYAIVLAIGRVLWQFLVWWNEGYILTNRRVIRAGGVLRRFRFEAPLSNIQHLAMVKSIPERIFGLGTIGFATAGTGGVEAAWLMVGKADGVFETVQKAVRNAGGRQ
ncbi:MAG: PH domain-containing protein [Phycisphaeraceae bacterium]|nr:PH domain-containing protein [Phycisphaeraceae bacterium]